MKVFVCYEENRLDLAAENGGVTDLCVKGSIGAAVNWVCSRLDAGIDAGFVIDEEASEYEDGVMKLHNLIDSLEEGCVSITMFSGHQENWEESYDIVVERKDVE